MGFGKDRIRSLPDALAKVLSMHFGLNGEAKKATNYEEKPELIGAITQPSLIDSPNIGSFDICPKCGEASLAHEEGCKKCYGCGYSEC